LDDARQSSSSSATNFTIPSTTLAIGPHFGGRTHEVIAASSHLLKLATLQPLSSLEAKAQISLGLGTRPGSYSVQDDPARAAMLATEYKDAIKAATLVALPPQTAGILRWSKSSYPSLDNPELTAPLEVAGLGEVSSLIKQSMSLNVTKVTQLVAQQTAAGQQSRVAPE